ncbi:hypothetical protein BT69DRAFT_1296168 [Atractiella rhizophila]|nr:hypothetical protein BT69DRAFT_1296168 [Atractiella rhizophila]
MVTLLEMGTRDQSDVTTPPAGVATVETEEQHKSALLHSSSSCSISCRSHHHFLINQGWHPSTWVDESSEADKRGEQTILELGKNRFLTGSDDAMKMMPILQYSVAKSVENPDGVSANVFSSLYDASMIVSTNITKDILNVHKARVMSNVNKEVLHVCSARDVKSGALKEELVEMHIHSIKSKHSR